MGAICAKRPKHNKILDSFKQQSTLKSRESVTSSQMKMSKRKYSKTAEDAQAIIDRGSILKNSKKSWKSCKKSVKVKETEVFNERRNSEV